MSWRRRLRIVEQVVLQIRIAIHHPDIAQNLVQHASRAAGAPLVAQLVQHLPGGLAQQADDDFAIRQRGVVVGNFAQPRFRFSFQRECRAAPGQICDGVHDPADFTH